LIAGHKCIEHERAVCGSYKEQSENGPQGPALQPIQTEGHDKTQDSRQSHVKETEAENGENQEIQNTSDKVEQGEKEQPSVIHLQD
jgi:hypothetical protein